MKHFIVIVLSLSLMQLHGQTGRDFATVRKEFEEYFRINGKNREYKQFKRWEWYTSTRLAPGGKITNVAARNEKAYMSSSVRRDLVSARTDANTGGWQHMGPTSVSASNQGIGRVNRIAFHPTNANTMYVATATGGMWATTNGGASWFPYSDGIPNMSLSGIAVNHQNPQIIYLLTGDGDANFSGAAGQFGYAKFSTGVLKTYDGGFTWWYTGLRFGETDAISAYDLVMDPDNPEILIAATSEGIWRTTNGGGNWTQQHNTIRFYDLEHNPADRDTVYAAGRSGANAQFYRSVDRGATFTLIESRTGARSAIAVTEADRRFVYWHIGAANGVGQFRGFFRSTNSGTSFTLRTNTPNILGRDNLGLDSDHQNGYDHCVTASNTNANIVMTGGIRLWTSTTGGTSFAYQDNYVGITSYYHDDIHDLAYHPLDNSKVFMCGDGGVYYSTDNGNNWLSLNNNLGVTQYYKISINRNQVNGTENIIIGGTQDNGTNRRSSSGSSAFTQILGSDGMDNVIDQDGASIYMAGIQNGKFYRSTNSGTDFTVFCDSNLVATSLGQNIDNPWVTPIADIPGSTISYLIGYRPIVRATVAGAVIFSSEGWSGRTFLKVNPNNKDHIIAGDNRYFESPDESLVKRSTDNGDTWTTVLSRVNSGAPVTDVAFNPDNFNELWLTYGGYDDTRKVFFSSNGGSTWTNITGTLPNVPINCIVYDDNNGSPDDALYIGTDIGVFYRDNNLGDWIPFSNGLPVVEVTDLEIHEGTDMLRAGTYGRGIWETSVYSNCASSITLNTTNTSYNRPYYFQASSSVISTATHYGTGSKVYYKGGSYVRLLDGFRAVPADEGEFRGFIGPCGGGVPFERGPVQARMFGVLKE